MRCFNIARKPQVKVIEYPTCTCAVHTHTDTYHHIHTTLVFSTGRSGRAQVCWRCANVPWSQREPASRPLDRINITAHRAREEPIKYSLITPPLYLFFQLWFFQLSCNTLKTHTVSVHTATLNPAVEALLVYSVIQSSWGRAWVKCYMEREILLGSNAEQGRHNAEEKLLLLLEHTYIQCSPSLLQVLTYTYNNNPT